MSDEQVERLEDAEARRAFASDSDTSHGQVPDAILTPRDTDGVVAAIQQANQTGTALVPVSSSGRRRRGDTVPARKNTLVLDLSRMRRLIHADSRDKVAIIEPGIDFGSIDELLQPHGLRALRPLAARAGKSVIASYLEREPLINGNEHWDLNDPFGGTSVVFGNGRYAPTGSAAIQGTLTEQLARGSRQMCPAGPMNLDPLRILQGAQGTLGVVTWAAVICERIPSLERAWFATAAHLEPVVDLAREMLHRRLGNGVFIVDCVQLALLLGRNAVEFQALGRALPAWTLFVSLSAGRERPAEKMAWQIADLERYAAEYGARLSEALEGHTAAALNRQLRTAERISFRDRALGAHRELFFIQQLHRAEEFVTTVRETMAETGEDLPIGVYIQPMVQGVNCHIEFSLPYAPRTASDHAAVADAWHCAARRCAAEGGFFSRPYGRWVEFAYEPDRGTRWLMRLAKSVFDPNGVMNPGRLPY